jgi:tRNA(Ile)-lysidine synthase
VSDALTQRFSAAIDALIGQAAASSGRFGVAVSGGPDSMALLDLAAQVFPGRVEAATVDHGLRPESGEEAAMVGAYCARRSIPHSILHPAVPIQGSLQAEARAARYALLDGWMDARGLDWLLTAHHADDQLETLVMRLNRGSGVAGLAGVRARRGRILRPLLAMRKAELAANVLAAAIPHVADPSNMDIRFDRARLRWHLTEAEWLDPVAAARSAAALADAEEALCWTTDGLYEQRVSRDAACLVLDTTGLPRELLRRLLARMMQEIAPDAPEPRGERIDQAIIQLCRGRRVSIGACVVAGGVQWSVRRAPPRRAS